MSDEMALAMREIVQMAADTGALKAAVARVHPDYDSVPKGTSTLVTACELLDHLAAQLAEVTRERDALAQIVERVREGA